MISPVPATAVPLTTADSSTASAPEATRLGSYEQAWQQGSPDAQARAHSSPNALGTDAMALVNRFQAQFQAFHTKLVSADMTTAPVQAAAFRPVGKQASADPATRPTEASVKLIVETFDFAVQEHLITQAATQLTGSVNTLVKAQ